MKKLFVTCFAALLIAFGASAANFYATDFGAKADGTTLNTASIQAAIDFAASNGGGRIIFTPGKFVTGTIYLKSGVSLHLEAGATLLGSINPWDYVKDPTVGWNAMIFAIRQENIGITGKGTVDGRGFITANQMVEYIHRGLFEDPMKLDRPNETNRPENIYFRECNNVTVTGITLKDPASWNQTYDQCHNVLVDGITVDSKSYWNNDGIDIVDCEDVVIRNCFIDAADDVFCFKSHSHDHMCNNVLLENCVGRSSANGVKFGTVSKGGFKNFIIRNITIYDTYRSAITFAAVDGAEIENIVVDGLRSYHTGNVIFLRVGLRWNKIHSLGVSDEVRNNVRFKEPYMKDIVIKNVYAEVPADKPDAGYNYEGPIEDLPRNISPAIIMCGLEKYKIENVTLENIEVHMPGAGNPLYAYRGSDAESLDAIPEMESYYPEFSQWKELPSWGSYLRHVNGLVFKNVNFFAEKKDYRPCVVADDVKGISFEKVDYNEPASEGKKQFINYKGE